MLGFVLVLGVFVAGCRTQCLWLCEYIHIHIWERNKKQGREEKERRGVEDDTKRRRRGEDDTER